MGPGATLSKGLNRGLGTIMAASLGLFVDYMADFTGAAAEPFVVGLSVFVVGMIATYTRTVPSIKAKYDYGVVVFLLTFCLVVISGYKVSDNIDVVFDRIVTIIVGVIICLLVSMFAFPIWAGDDLHKLVTTNFEGLANSLEECLKQYFQGSQRVGDVSSKICIGQPFDDKIYKEYKGVLISKQTEESLAVFASWEPRRFGCMYPWKTLVELGAITRHCAYVVSALHGCVLAKIQAPEQWRKAFEAPCMRVGEEVAKVLRSLAASIRAKCISPPKHDLLSQVRLAIDHLHFVAQTHPHFLISTHPNYNPPFPSPSPNPSTFLPPSSYNAPIYLSPSATSFSHLNNKMLHHLNLHPSPSPSPSLSSSPFPSPSFSPILYPNHSPTISPNPYANRTKPIHNFDPNHNPNLNPYPYDNPNPNSHNETSPISINIANSCTNLATPKANMKESSLMAPECMAFAETLSLASLIALLIEIVARLEHLIDANAEFQELAAFHKARDGDGSIHTSVEIKEKNGDHVNSIINQPISTSHVE